MTPARGGLGLAALLVLGSACGPEIPAQAPAPPLLLARELQALVALELPPTNHPAGAPAPPVAGLREPLKRCWHEDGLEQYCAPMPVSQIFYGHSFRTPPEGMTLLGPGDEVLLYEWDRTARPDLTTWRTRNGELQIRPARGNQPPAPGDLRVRYPPAAAWEDDLDPANSALSGSAFALREIGLDGERRHGLLLPAPGLARWQVDVPAGAVLDLDARLIPPGIDQGLVSDGARLRLRVVAAGEVTELADVALEEDDWRRVRVALDPWSGRQVEIELASDPGATNLLDTVFVANPQLYVPSREPRQVVLVFVDTLRRDHVGAYGYSRPTTPSLDTWMQHSVVFDDARATSSWTLPSTRALLTGSPQGAWGQVATLQQRLGEAGFVTGAFVANAFLTTAFDMGHGWGHYEYTLLAPADDQVDRALDFLERHDDRDAMVMVQLMDPHMPYNEPRAYQHRWAGEEPEGLHGNVHRRGLRGMNLQGEQQGQVRDFLVDRYDQNILFVDHELDRLFDHLREDAVVVVLSDHGEEFFEHGGVEHGHTLYDELLRVPLAVRAPGLEPGRVAAPVSLLDIAPTLLELLGIDGARDMAGISLVAAASGAPEASRVLAERPLFFGGLLYDDEAWGVRAPGGTKWIARGGVQQLYDLTADPGEREDLAVRPDQDLRRYPPLLAQALGREVRTGWRLRGPGNGRIVQGFDGRVTLQAPQGLERAWHPLSLTGDMAEPEIDADGLTVSRSPGRYLPREIFLLPQGDPLDADGLTLVVEQDGQRRQQRRSEQASPPSAPGASRQTLVSAGEGDGAFAVDLDIRPLPYPDEAPMPPFGSGMEDHLKALGYLDE